MTASERISDGAMLEPHERAGLLKFLEASFGLYELKSLALFLGADYSLFSHVRKKPLALDLLGYCERREQLGLLIAKMMQQQPGAPFLASLLAKLPQAPPRKKTQLVLSSEHGSSLNRPEMERALAEFFAVPQDQVAIVGIAGGTLRLLVSLPRRTACPQVRLGSHKLCKGRYEIFFITPLDALEPVSQRTWRSIVLNHPPIQQSTALRPAVSWKQVAQACESGVSSSPSVSAIPDRAQSPETRFLPRVLGAALGIALLVVLYIAVFVVFAAQNANRRSDAAAQAVFVEETTTAIELAAVGAQMSMAEKATVVAIPSIMPSSTVASTPTAQPTDTLRPMPASWSKLASWPTLTPTVTPTPGPRYRLVQQSRICPATPDSEAFGGRVSGGEVRITVLDQEGEQQPNVELLLRWSEGEDRAVTGLKPEIGMGYGDFVVAAGGSYQVAVIGAESEVAQGIMVDKCIGEGLEEGQIASWEVVFQLGGMALSE